MTIQEFIQKLKGYPQEMEVHLGGEGVDLGPPDEFQIADEEVREVGSERQWNYKLVKTGKQLLRIWGTRG